MIAEQWTDEGTDKTPSVRSKDCLSFPRSPRPSFCRLVGRCVCLPSHLSIKKVVFSRDWLRGKVCSTNESRKTAGRASELVTGRRAGRSVARPAGETAPTIARVAHSREKEIPQPMHFDLTHSHTRNSVSVSACLSTSRDSCVSAREHVCWPLSSVSLLCRSAAPRRSVCPSASLLGSAISKGDR